MNKFFFLVFSFLVIFSCKEKSTALVYNADCISKEGTGPVNFKLFIQDTTVVLVPEKSDPMVWPLRSKDGEMRTKINYQDFTIDFSNKDSIVGTLYKEAIKTVSTVTVEPVSMAESTNIDTVVDLQVMSSCLFKKGTR